MWSTACPSVRPSVVTELLFQVPLVSERGGNILRSEGRSVHLRLESETSNTPDTLMSKCNLYTWHRPSKPAMGKHFIILIMQSTVKTLSCHFTEPILHVRKNISVSMESQHFRLCVLCALKVWVSIAAQTSQQTLARETLLAAQVLNVLRASSERHPCNLFTAEAAASLSVPLRPLCWLCVKEEWAFNHSTSVRTEETLSAHTGAESALAWLTQRCQLCRVLLWRWETSKFHYRVIFNKANG